MSIESLKEDTKYLVISFDGSIDNNKESVDLIPRSWAFCDEGIWFCRYPDPKHYSKRDKWLEELKDPESQWEKLKITILKEARDHDQGIRRRQRSYKNINVVSTDDTDCDTDILPTKLFMAARKAFLHEAITEDVENSQETVITSTPKSRKLYPSGSQHSAESRLQLNSASTNCTDVTDHIISNTLSARPTSRRIHTEPEASNTNENTPPETILQEIGTNSPQIAAEANVSDDNWMKYLGKKIESLENRITAAIKSSKRSVLYDLEKKMNELKTTVIVATGGSVRGENASSAREKLATALPIEELDDYEAGITNDDQKKESLKSLFVIMIAGSNNWKDDVGKMLNSIISKTVQIHYSGCVRQVKGKGKRNFSQTVVFACMKGSSIIFVKEIKNLNGFDVLEEHYKNTNQPMQLVSRVSRWLASAGDREGGRLERGHTNV